MSVRLKAAEAIAPSTTESTTQGQASGTSTAHRSTPRPSERHDACCRRSFAVVEWPWSSACRRAVKPRSSSSSVLALARSRACTHASCPRSGLAECCSRKSTTERWPWFAAAMSAVLPRLPGKSTLAPRCSSSLTISSWPMPAAACSRP
eukprot:scaffold5570_cov69-Phaeocystis_antarctica.AAC.3